MKNYCTGSPVNTGLCHAENAHGKQHMLQYLKLAVVDDFIDWLAANLDQPLFAHAYVDRRHGPRTFTGLPDALSQYFWKHNGALGAPGGTCLTSSNAVLNALRQA